MGKQSSKLRELLKRPGFVAAAGAWDALSAKLVEAEGIEAIDINGSGVAHTMTGKPDIGYITQTEMLEVARRVAQAVNIPVIADCDDGFGSPLDVRRTVQLFEQAGVAGLHIEDNAMPKRCVHFGPGKLEPVEVMVQKVKAAVAARKDPDFIIIVRTDNHPGVGVDEVIARATAYAKAGADMAIIIGLKTVEDMRRACREVPIPLVGYQLGGQSPMLSPAEFENVGYKMVLYFSTLYTAAYMAARDAARNLKKGLQNKSQVPPLGGTWEDLIYLEEVVGLKEDAKLQEKYLFYIK